MSSFADLAYKDRVRTPEGAKKYGLPIGSLIVADRPDRPEQWAEVTDEDVEFLWEAVYGAPQPDYSVTDRHMSWPWNELEDIERADKLHQDNPGLLRWVVGAKMKIEANQFRSSLWDQIKHVQERVKVDPDARYGPPALAEVSDEDLAHLLALLVAPGASPYDHNDLTSALDLGGTEILQQLLGKESTTVYFEQEWLDEFTARHLGVLDWVRGISDVYEVYDEWVEEKNETRKPEEVHKQAVEQLREAVGPESGTITIRRGARGLEDILESGHFKTQFETGTSAGSYTPEGRSFMERRAWGYPTAWDTKGRPIYGYFDFHDAHTPGATSYGKYRIVLKPEVRRRTTVTADDSLSLRGFMPSPIDDPQWYSFGWDITNGDLERNFPVLVQTYQLPYMEVQIHGGVTVDDIQEVTFDSEAPEYIQKMLRERGIPYYREDTDERWTPEEKAVSFANLAYKAAVRRVRKAFHWRDPVSREFLPIGAIIPPGAYTGAARGTAGTPDAPDKVSKPRSGTARPAGPSTQPKVPPKPRPPKVRPAPPMTITPEMAKAPSSIYARPGAKTGKPKWPDIVPDVDDEFAEMFPQIDRGDLARVADMAWGPTSYSMHTDRLHPRYQEPRPGAESVWDTWAEHGAWTRWAEMFLAKYGRDRGAYEAWNFFAQRNRQAAIEAAVPAAKEWVEAHQRRSSHEKTDAPIPSYQGVPLQDIARVMLTLGPDGAQGRSVFEVGESVAGRLTFTRGWNARADNDWVEAFRREYSGVFERMYAEMAMDKHFKEWKAAHKDPAIRKMDDDELKDRMREELRRFVDDPQHVLVVRRDRYTTVEDILRRGRFKTQFETGRSGGYLGKNLRSAFESQVFGYPTDLDPEKRPVYGYISDGLAPGDTTGLQYGQIRIVLKPEAKRRATITIGDSLGNQDRYQPTPMTDPDWQSYQVSGYSHDLGTKPLIERDYMYPEFQVHGGLMADDIERIDFHPDRAPTTVLKALMRERGIPWRVGAGPWEGGDAEELPEGSTKKQRERTQSVQRLREARRSLYPRGTKLVPVEDMTDQQLHYELISIVSAVSRMERNPGETVVDFNKRKKLFALTKLEELRERGDLPRVLTEEEIERQRHRRKLSAAIRSLGAAFEGLEEETEEKAAPAVRRVRTLAGAEQYDQPIGTIIRTDLPDIDWEADRTPAHDQPELFPVEAPLLQGRRPMRSRIMAARGHHRTMTDQVRRSIEAEDEVVNFYNEYDGVHLGGYSESWGELGVDPDYAESVLFSMVAGTGPWPAHFNTCRHIRRSAYEMLGFELESTNSGDVHLETSAHRQARHQAITDDLADGLAYTLLKGIQESGGLSQTLYRGVDLHGYPFPKEIREGAILSLPLISTSDDVAGVRQFGTDITFQIMSTNAVQGADMSESEGDDELYESYEWVTGGQFKVLRVVEERQPTEAEIAQHLGARPERDDYEDEDEFYQELDEWRENFKDEAKGHGVEVDEDGDIIPWGDRPRYKVELLQTAVFDPDSGLAIEVKAAGRRRWDKVPAIDWMFEGSVSNSDHPALETVDD